MKKDISIASAIFLVSLLVGVLVGQWIVISQPTNGFEAVNIKVDYFYIFAKNLSTCMIFALGCGVITVPLLIVQSGAIGIQAGLWLGLNNPLDKLLVLLLPHGIIEIPAIIISGALGIKLGKIIISHLRTGASIKTQVKQLKRYYIAVFISLVIAAAIECYITPYIALWC